jgi:hypothetical protein
MSSDVVRWVLSNGQREMTCVLRPLDAGSKLGIIYYDGLPLDRHICLDDADAWQWSNENRTWWEAQGWTDIA